MPAISSMSFLYGFAWVYQTHLLVVGPTIMAFKLIYGLVCVRQPA